MYMVFGNDERMNEARKLLSVEKTQDVVCVFQPNVKVIKDDTKRIPWGARAYAFDFDEDARRILAEKSVKMIKYGENLGQKSACRRQRRVGQGNRRYTFKA